MENSVIVDDYQQIDRILKEERKYILELMKVTPRHFRLVCFEAGSCSHCLASAVGIGYRP